MAIALVGGRVRVLGTHRHGPLDGTAGPIAGLAHTHDLAGVGEGLLDSPPRRITGHQLFRGRFQIVVTNGSP